MNKPDLQNLSEKIALIRGQRVLLDSDLAAIYGVKTYRFNEAVKRNVRRFPKDFMFRLTREEAEALVRSRSQNAILKRGQNIKFCPYAFTEHGALMAANISRSEKAIRMSVFVVRAFVKLKEMISAHRDLAIKLKELEQRVGKHDGDIQSIIVAIQQLIAQEEKPKRKIGFHAD